MCGIVGYADELITRPAAPTPLPPLAAAVPVQVVSGETATLRSSCAEVPCSLVPSVTPE